MDYFPLFIKLKQQNCLVIGAGEVATRKIELLARAGAVITVIAIEISPAIASMQQTHKLILKQKAFEKEDIKEFRLVVSATNNTETNQLVADTATELNIPINVVDNPALCSFIFPAIIDRSPIIAAISSGGASPVLARLLRAKIESTIPSAYGQLAHLAEKFRSHVKTQIKEPAQRRIFWENVLQGRIAELVFSGKKQEAENQLIELISNAETTDNTGEVYLVGAGPGDPDLLTFKALRLMQQADVVVYDRLVSPEILDLT
ncbi:MAG: NAD-binding protein, partial [Methylococcales bacterium]|nr:NAD-binding protein [Methylococcales bacterium]